VLTGLPSRLRKTLAGLSGKAWFPRLPIALAVALLGVLYLLPAIDQAINLHLHLRTPGSFRQDLVGINLSGISQLSIGMFLLLMSGGLWFRSRAAWLLSVFVMGLAVIVRLLTLSTQPEMPWLLGYALVLTGILLASHRHFERTSFRFGTLAALIAVVVLFGYAVFGTYFLGDQFSPHIDNLTDAIYVSVVTMTTVGFGDFTPGTADARLFTVSIIILSIALLSTAVGATLIPAIIRKVEQITTARNIKMIRDGHYIIVGYSALSNNTYRELVSRQEQVTVILLHEADAAQFNNPDLDVVIGDGSDLETLRKAGAENAKAILALLDDDSENAFVVLAAKELNVKAKTVAAVNQSKHLNRIRRVHPDMIIAPQVLGGELLTSMLTGERIDINDVMGRLLGKTDAKPAVTPASTPGTTPPSAKTV
jgi:voltage-gated potassium channel